ncbi:CehA/McbA family metallohydrolase [Clostridium brassicae]|uniref:CehA/McbA family metallohydrolase n=1 Tax=Clostridium brassicae TaxID=2999072 RepID=A0ABT4DE64_9CLOT|nr:CehA/McbA family metallohydrolase [Clostridium brassicae]MCY6960605.1 CehA/McbA family metallohydrolase [Clostridium brassicae]
MIKFTPENKSKVTSTPKEICITLTNNEFKTSSKIKMYLDDKKVHSKFAKNKIYYSPKKKLPAGSHNVKIIIVDNNREYVIQWQFYIDIKKSKHNNYNFYLGNPHSHTSYSTGKGTPSEAFKYAFKKNLDFLIITDHSSRFRNTSKWEDTKKETDNFNKNYNKFLALRGFEVTSNRFGHFNVLGTNGYYRKIKDFNSFTNWLYKEDTKTIVCINHPHKYIESLDYNPHLDKFINFIEVGNGDLNNKYLKGEKYYYKLLDKGWHLGAINGQDNHKHNWGDSDNLTVVISKSLKTDDFMEALEERRTYSSESRTLNLSFKANNYWMGSIIPINKKINFNIKIEDKKNPINKIELISNDAKIINSKKISKKKKAKWDFSLNYKKNKWYVIKVIYENGFCGISSPIFTKTENNPVF